MEENKVYIAIDLKSFYASVECLERGLDPLNTNLVVADTSRTQKTICLAVTPSLKSYGVPGRPRLFEVIKKIRQVNASRLSKAPNRCFESKSYNHRELKKSPQVAVSYIVAPPRMELYMDYSTRIYNVYLNYVAPEDIHVYSIDEVFIDITNYLKLYKRTPYEIANRLIKDIFKTTGVSSRAGIGTNLYLAKIAMDIVTKTIKPHKDGGCIAQLDEISYRKLLWTHRPITDFWRVGKGYADKLETQRIYTMGDIARCSIGKSNDYYNEDLLYQLFGVRYDRENLTNRNRKTYQGEISLDSYGRKVPKHARGTANLSQQTSSTILIMEAIMALFDRIVDKNLLVRKVSMTASKVVSEDITLKNPDQLDLFAPS